MKLSEIRPCDACAGKIAPIFQVVRISAGIFKAGAVNSTLGLTQMFGGSLGLAEAMSPDPEAVTVAGDEKSELMMELFICQECFLAGPIDLALLIEKRCQELAKKGEVSA